MSGGPDSGSEEGQWLGRQEGGAPHDEVLLCLIELLALRDDVGEGVASKSSTELHIDVFDDRIASLGDSGSILRSKRHLLDEGLRDHVTITIISWASTQMGSQLGDVLVHVNPVVKDDWWASGSRDSDLSRVKETRTNSSTG